MRLQILFVAIYFSWADNDCVLSHVGKFIVRIDPWFEDGLRVRMWRNGAQPRGSGSEYLLDAGTSKNCRVSETTLSNGNIVVNIDPRTALKTFISKHNSEILLEETEIFFESLENSLSAASVSFRGDTEEKIYGLGHDQSSLAFRKSGNYLMMQ